MNQTTNGITLSTQFQLWPIEKLIPYARNPRTHSDAQVAQIAAASPSSGSTGPGGHRRRHHRRPRPAAAARKLGLERCR